MPVVYVLRGHVGASSIDVPLEDGTLGYPHVIIRDDETAQDLEIANVPPEAPPVGEFPVYNSAGVLLYTVPFAVLNVDTGPPLVLRAFAHSLIDFSRRLSVGQYGDSLTVRLKFLPPNSTSPAPDLTGASVLQLVFQRPDRTALVATATLVAGTTDTVEYTLQPGESDSAGQWEAQGYAVLASGAPLHSQVQTFRLLHNLPTS